MKLLEWTPDLNTGIEIIDEQHMQIINLINKLHEARMNNDVKQVAEVLEGTIDYTEFHFAFEEQMLKDAGYEFVLGHKRVHELFIRRVMEYYERFQAGQPIAEQLEGLLSRWLLGHIKREDMAYAEVVRAYLSKQGHDNYKKKEKGFFARWFKFMRDD